MHQTGYWWDKKLSAKDSAGLLASVIQRIDDRGPGQRASNLRHARMYGNTDFLGLGPYSYGISPENFSNRIALNLIAACVDTLSAKITKNEPRPSIQTYGGDIKMQKKAKKLEDFLAGAFDEAGVHKVMPLVFKDSCIFGTGVAHVFEHDGKLAFERAFVDEFRVDEADGWMGKPRQLFRQRPLPREVVMAAFGDTAEKRQAIADAPKHNDRQMILTDDTSDIVTVNEAWHLPSSKDAEDGRHVIAVGEGLLVDEPWEEDFFPFVFLKYQTRPIGFFGQGISERLFGIQIEINRILRDIQEHMRLLSKGKYMIENGSKVIKSHINNEVGTLVTYSGTPPQLVAANAVPPEQFSQLDRLWQRGFESEGISQLSATSKKPGGLDSGAALREFNDIESERFLPQGRGYEQSFLEIGRLFLWQVRKIAERDGDMEVKASYRNALRPLKWSEVSIDEDRVKLRMMPASSLPLSPSARRQEVQEWIQAGFVDQTEGRRLMNMPDLDYSDSLATAQLDEIDDLFDKALEEEEPQPIDEYLDLATFINRGKMHYFKAKQGGASQGALEAMIVMIRQAESMAPPPQPAQPAVPPIPEPGQQ